MMKKLFYCAPRCPGRRQQHLTHCIQRRNEGVQPPALARWLIQQQWQTVWWWFDLHLFFYQQQSSNEDPGNWLSRHRICLGYVRADLPQQEKEQGSAKKPWRPWNQGPKAQKWCSTNRTASHRICRLGNDPRKQILSAISASRGPCDLPAIRQHLVHQTSSTAWTKSETECSLRRRICARNRWDEKIYVRLSQSRLRHGLYSQKTQGIVNQWQKARPASRDERSGIDCLCNRL